MTLADLVALREPGADRAKPRLKMTAQDLLGSLLRVRARHRRAEAPRAIVRLSVYRPDGRSAVTLTFGRPV